MSIAFFVYSSGFLSGRYAFLLFQTIENQRLRLVVIVKTRSDKWKTPKRSTDRHRQGRGISEENFDIMEARRRSTGNDRDKNDGDNSSRGA